MASLQITETYWNDSVVQFFAEEENLSRDVAEKLFKEMLDFLDLSVESGAPASPSKAIDKAWHAFILHTRDYSEYCLNRFGFFLHHEPSRVPSYKRSKGAAVQRSDIEDVKRWAMDDWSTADCTTGNDDPSDPDISLAATRLH